MKLKFKKMKFGLLATTQFWNFRLRICYPKIKDECLCFFAWVWIFFHVNGVTVSGNWVLDQGGNNKGLEQFINFTLDKMLLEWSNQGVWNGHGMYHDREMCKMLTWLLIATEKCNEPSGSVEEGNFLNSWARRTLVHGVYQSVRHTSYT